MLFSRPRTLMFCFVSDRHEVSILKEGEAKFEYVNCDPGTGVIKWVPLDRESLD